MNEDLQRLMKSIIVVIITVKKIADSFIGKVFQGQKYSTYKKLQTLLSDQNNITKDYRAVFNWVSKIISELHWFCITSLSDWFKGLMPFFQPIRSETKTICGLHVHIFPCFVSAMCIITLSWVLVGLLDCLCPFWLAKVITLVLVLRHSIETHSIYYTPNTQFPFKSSVWHLFIFLLLKGIPGRRGPNGAQGPIGPPGPPGNPLVVTIGIPGAPVSNFSSLHQGKLTK